MHLADHQLLLPIITRRLVIRDPVRADMSGWSALYRSPKVRCYMNGPLKRTAKEWWTGIQQPRTNIDRPLSIVFPKTDELAGVCGFLKSSQPEVWEIWLLLRSKFWGNAFGAEVTSALVEAAFSLLGAKGVIGIVDPKNQRSLSMITSLGFSFLREYSGNLTWQKGHHIYCVERNIKNTSAHQTLRNKTKGRHRSPRQEKWR